MAPPRALGTVGPVTAVLESSALEAAAAPVAPRREDALARTALVVVALGVADDAFVHREPGTAIGDHLASGLVPAAVAVALAVG